MLGSGDTGHHLCHVCAEPVCPPVHPFGQILSTFRQLKMVNIWMCNLPPFFLPWICLVPLSWRQTQDKAKCPETKPWPSSYSSSPKKLEYSLWNEQRMCFWLEPLQLVGLQHEEGSENVSLDLILLHLAGPLKQLGQELQFRCLMCLFSMNRFPTWAVSPMADHSWRSLLGIVAVFPTG